MPSVTEEYPIAPSLGRYLDEKHIDRSVGKSICHWSRNTKIPYSGLRSMLRGDRVFRLQTIIDLSKLFGEPIETLIRVQNRFLLETYRSKYGANKLCGKIGPVVVQKKNILRETIEEGFLKPKNIKLSDVAKHLDIEHDNFRKFFSLKKATQTPGDYMIAYKIGEALGTGGELWLDTLTKMQLDDYLSRNQFLRRYFDWEVKKDFSTRRWANAQNPGYVLYKEFIDPSRIAKRYWADFFCVGGRTLERIIGGKVVMDFRFISLLVKAFSKPAGYWIEMQNEYLISKCHNEQNTKNCIGLIQPRLPLEKKLSTPGKILEYEFLKPRNISLGEFAKHIRISGGFVRRLVRGQNQITVPLAVKLSQAFGNSPMFWLDMQMNFDLARGMGSNKGCFLNTGKKPLTRNQF